MNEVAGPVNRGRGRPSGPRLEVLLTRNFPDGATAEMLIGAGFRGDLAAALKREDINEQHGRYVWVAMSKSEASNITAPRALSNPPAPVPPVPVVDLARLNKDELQTQPSCIEEISLDKIRVTARRRVLDQVKVDAIADSMDRIGLQIPITVYGTDNDDFELGVGLHRHAAAKSLGWTKFFAESFRWMSAHASSGKSTKICVARNSMNWNAASIWWPGKQSTSSCTRTRGMSISVVALVGVIKRPQNLRPFLSLPRPLPKPGFRCGPSSNRFIAPRTSLPRCATQSATSQKSLTRVSS
jgi:hypothetical protein